MVDSEAQPRRVEGSCDDAPCTVAAAKILAPRSPGAFRPAWTAAYLDQGGTSEARRMVFWGSLAYGIGVLAVPRLSPTWLWALMPWLGICSAVMFVPSLLWLLERARGIGRNTTMASFHAAGSLGFLLGPVCCGALVDLGGGLAGYEIAFTVAGLSVVAGAWLVRRDAPGSRGRP